MVIKQATESIKLEMKPTTFDGETMCSNYRLQFEAAVECNG